MATTLLQRPQERKFTSGAEFLSQICANCPVQEHVALICAHSDDETIGVGTRMRFLERLSLIYVTNSSPANLQDAIRSGFETRAAYAEARQLELKAALCTAGVAPIAIHQIGVMDQAASLMLGDLAHAISGLLREMDCAFVITHPYEGGHPDHDATAFAVHLACELLLRRRGWAPLILEMTSYHENHGSFEQGCFLNEQSSEVFTAQLREEERWLKAAMLACFRSQQITLGAFQLETERFRVAPRYCFTEAPHSGPLYYERFPWGVTGDQFRQLASAALLRLNRHMMR